MKHINYTSFSLFFVFTLLFYACDYSGKETGSSSKKAKSESSVDLPDYQGMATLEIPSKDGLTMTVNLYHLDNDKPVAVLCHQAGSAKEEYNEIAERLNKMGFNCLAIDQRSGGEALGGDNRTAVRAKEAGKPTSYLDAEQDILAAVKYAARLYKKQVLLVGSSYSASLALKIGRGNLQVMGVAAFSPGEYFKEKGEQYIGNSMKDFNKPLFLTSSKSESADVAGFLVYADKNKTTHFIPEEEGIHGARALWSSTPNHKAYWTAFEAFLSEL